MLSRELRHDLLRHVTRHVAFEEVRTLVTRRSAYPTDDSHRDSIRHVKIAEAGEERDMGIIASDTSATESATTASEDKLIRSRYDHRRIPTTTTTAVEDGEERGKRAHHIAQQFQSMTSHGDQLQSAVNGHAFDSGYETKNSPKDCTSLHEPIRMALAYSAAYNWLVRFWLVLVSLSNNSLLDSPDIPSSRLLDCATLS